MVLGVHGKLSMVHVCRTWVPWLWAIHRYTVDGQLALARGVGGLAIFIPAGDTDACALPLKYRNTNVHLLCHYFAAVCRRARVAEWHAKFQA